MSAVCLLLAIICWVRGWCLFPHRSSEAANPLAPYRAIRALLFILLGWGFFLAAIGVRVVVAVSP
ncbi:hypothetical protein ACVCL0_09130 [Rhodanobacter sp. UC4450_H17]